LGRDFFVSVNLSPRQLEQKDLLAIVAEAIEESGINPSCLELEITEGVLMKDSINTTGILEGLRKLGVRIAIDDFGTGFSNMSYLLRLPIDCLKIDRSIISGCSVTSNTSTVARAIIALAHQLKLSVVAEGAEIVEEVDFLQHEKCDRVQGFYFSKALPLDEILAMNFNGPDHGLVLRSAAQIAAPDRETFAHPDV
jgi:EAL domain-containing protein (putative c-di-GMP-specific phosphodiesterase class I)